VDYSVFNPNDLAGLRDDLEATNKLLSEAGIPSQSADGRILSLADRVRILIAQAGWVKSSCDEVLPV